MTDLARSPHQIGNLIRRQRRKLGLSQAQLGDKAGLRQGTVSLIESGSPSTRLDTILGILAALDLEFRIGSRARGSLAQDIEDLVG
jgi:HTH-type transcriptional regulator/antitoxin HipB